MGRQHSDVPSSPRSAARSRPRRVAGDGSVPLTCRAAAAKAVTGHPGASALPSSSPGQHRRPSAELVPGGVCGSLVLWRGKSGQTRSPRPPRRDVEVPGSSPPVWARWQPGTSSPSCRCPCVPAGTPPSHPTRAQRAVPRAVGWPPLALPVVRPRGPGAATRPSLHDLGPRGSCREVRAVALWGQAPPPRACIRGAAGIPCPPRAPLPPLPPTASASCISF